MLPLMVICSLLVDFKQFISQSDDFFKIFFFVYYAKRSEEGFLCNFEKKISLLDWNTSYFELLLMAGNFQCSSQPQWF